MSSGLSAAYFGAYLLCPPTFAGWILRHFGFRVTFMCGLAVLSVGCLLMWPSGIKHSFGGFCGSMFVVGMGLSTLETAADPFLAICGPPRYSEIRLNLAQAVQAMGSFVAPLLASRVFFASTVDDAEGLKNVQWVYLSVSGFVSFLIFLFFIAPMPEITDADMGTQANIFAVAQGLYALNRFIAGGLMTLRIFRPRLILAAYLLLSFLFTFLAVITKDATSISMLCLVLCFESACFATIFTLGLRGLGRFTKIGGSLIVAAISGGAVFPPIAGAVATRLQRNGSKKPFHYAMIVPMAGFIIAFIYPLYINIWNRNTIDIRRETRVGIEIAVESKDIEEKNMRLD
ncbi:Glucose/galactose transporter [Golovinomyces cichoracearum]|uniref:Glucose/galactose transporter n=1 Tax=Golovinomyces cichoracearum TaxID=62708 RepID=A0A420HVT8_9PEZI|nr:Glucose/galactose transporter [Golovinomyces cichoracearum]